MKSIAELPNGPHLPGELSVVSVAVWQAAVEFTRDQARATPGVGDEWSAFWWHAWRPASRKWRMLLHDGGSEAFRLLRGVWDEARRPRG